MPRPLVQIECHKCKQRYSVEVPMIEIVNRPNMSVVLAPHENFITCTNAKCKAQQVMMMASCDTTWTTTPVPDDIAAASKPLIDVVGAMPNLAQFQRRG